MTTQTRAPLTARQQEYLDFIRANLAERGRAPAFREIAAHFGIGSTNAVKSVLRPLEKKGYIRTEYKKARGIELVEDAAGELPGTVEVCVNRVRLELPARTNYLDPSAAIALGLALVQAARRAQAVARA